ncbi:5897_t:CDS:2 [Gigaspora rosea]|nr:5897_t:CDS:2 [Gigaspora rosea]
MDKNHRYTLIYAARNGHLKIVENLLKNETNINIIDNDKRTALNWAAENGHIDVIKVLIRHGADVNAIDKDEHTALNRAAEKGRIEIIKTLIEHKAIVNHMALYLAVVKCQTEAIKILIEYGVDVNSIVNNLPILHHAAKNEQHVEVVKTLLKHGAKIDSTDNSKRTIFDINKNMIKHGLHFAALDGREDIITYLLKKYGADYVNDADVNGKTALHLSAENGHETIVNILINYKAVLSIRDKSFKTALHLAAKKCHTAIVEILINNKAKVDAFDKDSRTSLFYAAESGNEKTIDVLIKYNADINHTDNDGVSALHKASENGQPAAVETLLRSKAKVNTKDKNGETALHKAAFHGHRDVVRLLIKYKADDKAFNKDNWTLLHFAAAAGHTNKGHVDTVKLLLEANHHEQNSYSTHFAVEEIYTNIIKSSSKKKACKHAILHHVAEKGDTKTIKFLIENGEKPDSRDENNKTPLHWAAFGGNEDAKQHYMKLCEMGIKELLNFYEKRGANSYARNKYGWAPIHVAAIHCQVEIFKFMKLCDDEYIKLLKQSDDFNWDDHFKSKDPYDITIGLVKRSDKLESQFQKNDKSLVFFCQFLLKYIERFTTHLDEAEKSTQYKKDAETMDEKLKEAIERLELTIRTNIIICHFKKAIDVFKQWVFPYACMYSNVLSSQLDDIDKIVEKINNLRFKVQEHYVFINNRKDKYLIDAEFNSEYKSSHPFFVWGNKKYSEKISKLLNGEEVAIYADIMESSSKKSAIKFNEIGIRFKSKDKTLQDEIDNELKQFNITMAHSGELMFSPYTMWKVKIESIEDDDYSKLKRFEKEVDLELVGHGKSKVSNDLTLEQNIFISIFLNLM